MDRSDIYRTEVTFFFLCWTELSFSTFLLVRSVFFPNNKRIKIDDMRVLVGVGGGGTLLSHKRIILNQTLYIRSVRTSSVFETLINTITKSNVKQIH